MRHALIAVAVALALPAPALAQVARVELPRVQGTVTAVSDSSLTLDTASGPVTVALIPSRTVNVVSPIALDQIAPGSYVATANTTQADGTGVSTELRVYPPGPNRRNVNAPMGGDGQTMMTNGTVAKAVSVSAGRVLTVDYGGGTREILVRPEIGVVLNEPGTPAMIKPGVKLTIATAQGANGPTFQIITIAKADLLAG